MIHGSDQEPSESLGKMSECLCDEEKMPLVQDCASSPDFLCYKALPQYGKFVGSREEKMKFEKMGRTIPNKYNKFLTGDNQPIPIKNEHEFAHLYLEEVYSNLSRCNILELGLDALLTILSKASCFPEELRKQALIVRQLRNKWLCSNSDYWTKDESSKALEQLSQLARMIPGAMQSLGKSELKFPGVAFFSNVEAYRTSIQDGQHEKIEFKITKLQSIAGREIFVERRFQETATGKTTMSVRDLLQPNKVVLLKGEAGSGKSSVATKLMQRWADGEEKEDIACS